MNNKKVIFEIDEYIIEIDNMFEVKVSIHSKKDPQVVFKITTKFWAIRLNRDDNDFGYLHLEKFPKDHLLHQFEVEKKDGIILVYNTETKIRICRIPISFMDRVIDQCNKLVIDCLNEVEAWGVLTNEETKTIHINTNHKIYFHLNYDDNGRAGYLYFPDGEYLADWMTLLEYKSIPDYEILSEIRKRINTTDSTRSTFQERMIKMAQESKKKIMSDPGSLLY